jgi:hypothetical protein
VAAAGARGGQRPRAWLLRVCVTTLGSCLGGRVACVAAKVDSAGPGPVLRGGEGPRHGSAKAGRGVGRHAAGRSGCGGRPGWG